MCAWDHGSPKWCFHSNSDFLSLQVIILWWSSRVWPTSGGRFGRGGEGVCSHSFFH